MRLIRPRLISLIFLDILWGLPHIASSEQRGNFQWPILSIRKCKWTKVK